MWAGGCAGLLLFLIGATDACQFTKFSSTVQLRDEKVISQEANNCEGLPALAHFTRVDDGGGGD